MSSLPLDPTDRTASEPPRSRARWKFFAIVVLLLLLLPASWLARRGASKLAFFRVRSVVVDGTHYLSPDTVVARLKIDTLRSVFDDVPPLVERLSKMPQVADVKISRKLPGTLVVTIRENPPVALVTGPQGLEPVDAAGVPLPIDPSKETSLDLPVSDQRDVALTKMLGDIHSTSAVLFRRVSEVSRTNAGDVLLLLTTPGSRAPAVTPAIASAPSDSTAVTSLDTPGMLRVRARMGVSATRLTDIFPVEFDLRRRGARVAELDLRYRDQVIARLQ
ncbi:MAG TPA: FtsQ-type POTRA domain-containing protein [Gemmatimonadaceae bacterium]|nr:FtsQ-type POTRA domain-containing protein [Gemmatimonadaceae bacterium]